MLYGNDGIYIAGLTGMSGAGKTTACRVFAENGFEIVNCDEVARAVVEKGRPALCMIAERFGDDIMNADGTLDRRKLGGIVFSDSAALEALNGIIYPFITFGIISRITRMVAEGKRTVLLDAPTLFESGADKLCDTIVCVTADREFCVTRIMRRDGIDREMAEKRLGSQHDADFYKTRCGYCAENAGTLAEFQDTMRTIAVSVKNDAPAAFRRV